MERGFFGGNATRFGEAHPSRGARLSECFEDLYRLTTADQNEFASATETVTQSESRLSRFDGMHDPCECRVSIHSIRNLLLPC
jgi:hypothetical protein